VLVLELRRGEHVLGVDHQEQVIVRLQVDVPGVGGGRHIGCRRRVPRIAHVDHAEALGEHVAGIGVATMHHQLHAIRAAALVAVADQPQVAGVVRYR
jgi:hypothetical protein